MTLTYHSGERIQGLAYTAPNITKDENFSNVWNGVGSNIAITDGELVSTSMQSSGDNRVFQSLGFSLVDTAWVLRFEYTPTTSSSGAYYMPIALTAGNGALNASADAVRLYIDMGSYTAFFRSKDGGTEGSSGQTVNLSAGTKYYFTVVNNNRSLTATIRTGSHSGSVFSTRTATIQNGVTGLNHIQSGASSFNSGTNTYTVDNIEIWNNMTSISGTATYTENFSSATIWSQDPSDSQFTVSYSESNTDVNDIAPFENGTSANGVIGEKIEINSFEKVEAPFVGSYIHAGNKIATLVGLSASVEGANVVAKDVAMQAAAMNPIALNEDGVDASIIEKEIEIAKDQLRQEGKPEAMLENIAKGKIKRFFKDNTLVNQAFIKDGKQSVAEYVKSIGDVSVVSYSRVALG